MLAAAHLLIGSNDKGRAGINNTLVQGFTGKTTKNHRMRDA